MSQKKAAATTNNLITKQKEETWKTLLNATNSIDIRQSLIWALKKAFIFNQTFNINQIIINFFEININQISPEIFE